MVSLFPLAVLIETAPCFSGLASGLVSHTPRGEPILLTRDDGSFAGQP